MGFCPEEVAGSIGGGLGDEGRAGPSGGRGVLHGAFAVLEELARVEEAGLTQLAVATGLPKATAHRLLCRLTDLGVVHREDGGRYRIGTRMFRWGQRWSPAQVLSTAAVRPLRRLAAAGCSVTIAVRDGDDVIVVAGIGDPAVDEVFRMRPGIVLPAASAAEVVLAVGNPASGLRPDPGWSLPPGHSRAEWARRVGDARDRRVAFDFEAALPPLGCVAAPVRAPTGAVVAAAAVVVVGTNRLPLLADAVRETAACISANLARVPGAGRALNLLATPESPPRDR
ncbi:helix-turn-helix domain-containing protein [Nonomuraea sp. NPDC049607]|uniref:IclR family transcriptional regulator n=1 Tax=Nonomuraea sp. NPDC049607 TaxID=3154732 RepID=UPI00343823D8